jgi:hypothetical protein
MFLLRGNSKYSKLTKYLYNKFQSYLKLPDIISFSPVFLEICLSPQIFKFHFKSINNCNNFIQLTGGNRVKT